MDSAMYLSLYIGLLSATAIVATLLTYKPPTIAQGRAVRSMIFAYGCSAIFSTIGIMEVILGTDSISIVGSTITVDFMIAVASLGFFVLGTEALILTAYRSAIEKS